MRPSRLAALAVAACLLAPGPAVAATEAQRAYKAGLAAYVYGFPPVVHRLSQAAFPLNLLVGIAATATPEDKLVVRPNVDTVYTVGRIDLRAEPVVVGVPAIAGRYYSLALMDAYTNVFGYIGSRTTGTAAGDYAIVGPDFSGSLPAGVRRIRSPTNDVLLLGRTLVESPDDLPAVRDLLGTYTLTPLSTVEDGGEAGKSLVLDESPTRTPPVLPTGLEFFDALGQVLADDPPPAADAKLLRTLAPFGIGSGIKTSEAGLSKSVRAALIRAVTAGPGRIRALAKTRRRRSERQHHGWQLLDPKTGDAGTDYDLRAVVADVGLWANTPAEATYPMTSSDRDLAPLTGKRRYVLRFAGGQLPPARAFWSLTMYDAARHLYANPLRRYALGDRSAGLKHDRDGGLTLYLQHGRPAGHVGNWLPAPAGRFSVTLRLYVPAKPALDGRWSPPGIVRVR